MSTQRFPDLFASLAQRSSTTGHTEGAFVPFIMLGDPTMELSLDIIRTVVDAGADALELGIPFSDPVADGPTIQRSHIRALPHGSIPQCLAALEHIRAEFPDLPISLMIYGNVPFTRGFERFYQEFADAGADAILIPDIPVRESAPCVQAAHRANIAPVYIAPARAAEETLAAVAATSEDYIYAISRDGVTGVEQESETAGLATVVANLEKYDGAPILLGFGISRPEHVHDAIAAGARGAITGSAITALIEKFADSPEQLLRELASYVAEMKAATILAS